MAFIKKQQDLKPLDDTVFRNNTLAKTRKSEGVDVINATIGTLCDEDGNIVAYKSVYNDIKKMDDKIKASYPDSLKGNKKYLDAIYKFVIEDNCPSLYHREIAATGGSGSISSSIGAMLDEGSSILIPSIAWGSYKLMAEQNHLKPVTYNMFKNNKFDLSDVKQKMKEIVKNEGKVFFIINDPLQNPTGYSLTQNEWKNLIDFVNTLDGEVIILNDIAYIDYSFRKNPKEYMKLFNNINDNVAIIVAFSGSKTMTSYGLRYGASIVLTKKEEDAINIVNVLEKIGRATWSCVNNCGMNSFVNMFYNYQDKFLKEKKKYINLLKKRASVILRNAKEVGIPLYPFKEGFFVTIKCEDNASRDELYNKLLDRDIYLVKTNLGLRIAICSLPLNQCKIIMQKIKECM